MEEYLLFTFFQIEIANILQPMSPSIVRNTGDSEKKQELWVNLVIEDVQGQNLEASIPLIFAPGVYKSPDIPFVVETSAFWIMRSLDESGLILAGECAKRLHGFAVDMAKLSAYFLSGCDPASDAFAVYAWNLTLSFIMDDLFEANNFFGRNKEIRPELIGEIICGKFSSVKDLPQVPAELQRVCAAQLLAIQKAKEVIPRFSDYAQYFADAYTNTFSAIRVFEMDANLRNNGTIDQLPDDTYQHLRRHDSAVEAFLELAFICSGVHPSRTLRNDLLFRRLLELASSAIAHSNDLFGIRRDFNSGLGYNLAVHKAKSRPLAKSFEQVAQICQQDVLNIRAISQRLQIHYDNDKDINRILKIVGSYVDGHIYWNMENTRYGNIKMALVTRDQSGKLN